MPFSCSTSPDTPESLSATMHRNHPQPKLQTAYRTPSPGLRPLPSSGVCALICSAHNRRSVGPVSRRPQQIVPTPLNPRRSIAGCRSIRSDDTIDRRNSHRTKLALAPWQFRAPRDAPEPDSP